MATSPCKPGAFSRKWPTLYRWAKFNVVGASGIVVQLTILKFAAEMGLAVQAATVLAVEIAVLNNFFWHVRYTWTDRRSGNTADLLGQLIRFHLTNGLLSLAVSWLLMGVLVTRVGVPLVLANLVCIVACSVMNFLMAEVIVFRKSLKKRGSRRPRIIRPAERYVSEF